MPWATRTDRRHPQSSTFKDFIFGGWAERPEPTPTPRAQAPYAADRRARISAMHPGERLVIPAGPAKTRVERHRLPVPRALGVLVPDRLGQRRGPRLGARARADRRRPRRDALPAADGGARLRGVLRQRRDRRVLDRTAPEPRARRRRPRPRDPAPRRVRGGARCDRRHHPHRARGRPRPHRPARRPPPARRRGCRRPSTRTSTPTSSATSARCASSRTTTRSARCASRSTRRKQGFDDVIADLPQIVAHPRGERLVEGTFYRRARAEGNQVGYDTIAASGPHACILHWTRNDGPVDAGRPDPARRRHRARLALHGRHHPHAADLGHVHRRAAPGLRGGARGGGCCARDREAGHPVPRGARRRDDRSSPARPPSGACCR